MSRTFTEEEMLTYKSHTENQLRKTISDRDRIIARISREYAELELTKKTTEETLRTLNEKYRQCKKEMGQSDIFDVAMSNVVD